MAVKFNSRINPNLIKNHPLFKAYLITSSYLKDNEYPPNLKKKCTEESLLSNKNVHPLNQVKKSDHLPSIILDVNLFLLHKYQELVGDLKFKKLKLNYIAIHDCSNNILVYNLPIATQLNKSFKKEFRMAGEPLEIGKVIEIPSNFSLSRNNKFIKLWDDKKLDHFKNTKKNSFPLSNLRKPKELPFSNFYNKFKVISFDRNKVMLQGLQISFCGLDTILGDRFDYSEKQRCYSFSNTPVNLKVADNNILFL